MPPVALTIAGSDPSGGAGIQADLKTFHQFGVYGQAAVTLLTVQNTRTVSRVEPMSAELVRQQIEAVVSDIPPAAAKTGALGSSAVVETVADLARNFSFPLVVDPVMISKHGARLISPDAEQMLKCELLRFTYLLTPNIPEAESLTGLVLRSEQDMAEAGRRLLDFGCRAVLVKAGHAEGEPNDLLVTPERTERFPGQRVHTKRTHGTGCTYSAAITACLAKGYSLSESVAAAKRFVQAAIETAPELGVGHGPVNHFANTSAPSGQPCPTRP